MPALAIFAHGQRRAAPLISFAIIDDTLMIFEAFTLSRRFFAASH
jgi:hypothetical protein